MYCYHFTKYAGTDRVFITDQNLGQVGDLVICGEGEYVLLLGEHVAWKEQGSYKLEATSYKLQAASWKPREKNVKCKNSSEANHLRKYNIQTIIPWLLRSRSIDLLHWFVNEWYTTYKNALPLWLYDIEDIIKRQAKKKNEKWKMQNVECKSQKIIFKNEKLLVSEEEIGGQQLVVFPDLWTLHNEVGWDKNEIFHLPQVSFLHGKSTKKQKSDAFLGIRDWSIGTLFCTYSQIFQDWQNLQQIILIDQHKRYYKNQQDPRYYVPTVLEKMAKIWNTELVKSGRSLPT